MTLQGVIRPEVMPPFCSMLPLAILLLCATPTHAVATPVTVPMVYYHHVVLVGVRIANSGPYTFLLDTDTTPSAIDLALARKIGLRFNGPVGKGEGVGTASSAVLPLTIPSLSVGPIMATNVAALATDLSDISKRLHRTIDGVLGTSFLNGRVVQFDYGCRNLTFSPSAPRLLATARFRSGNENVSNDAWVGSKRLDVTFDTGDAGYLFLTRKGIAALPAVVVRGGESVVVGYNGAEKARHALVTGLRIGGIRLPPTDAVLLAADESPYHLNIGNRTLERFVVTFDYQHDLVKLSPARTCHSISHEDLSQ